MTALQDTLCSGSAEERPGSILQTDDLDEACPTGVPKFQRSPRVCFPGLLDEQLGKLRT